MKRTRGIFPFFHPTTVMFVDDNHHYLVGLARHFVPMEACRFFVYPHDALAVLRGRAEPSPAGGCVSLFADNPNPVRDHLIRLDLRSIATTLFNPARFAEVSVVVVNYDMPGINGVELCRELADLPVKKLIFTGSADEHLAVEAFNEGVIDGFMRKGEGKLFEQLGERITELQRQYFADQSRFVAEALSYDSMEFLRDPGFIEFFQDLCRERGVTEYYVSNEPTGLVLGDGDGRITLLAVQSEAQMAATRELASGLGVERELVNEIARRRMMPVFWWGEGESEGEPRAWANHLYPAGSLASGYYYALVEGVERRMSEPPPLSFNDYLARRVAEQRGGESFVEAS